VVREIACTVTKTPLHIGLILVAIGVALFVIRMTGPDRLLYDDQLKPAAYATDAIVNGDWIVQTDTDGNVASKPPLTTWMIGALSLPGGQVTRLTLALPSALAMIGLAVLVGELGRRHFGPMAGLLAGAAMLLNSAGFKQVALVRTDAVFGFMVTLMALLAWLAWTRRANWLWFWLIGGLATLTKGPLCLLLAAGGLLAMPWCRRMERLFQEKRAAWKLGLQHVGGAALFLLIAGGWALLAWHAEGQAFVDKVIGDELVGHAVGTEMKTSLLSGLYKSPLYFLTRYLPLSVFTYIALVRVVRAPVEDPLQRRFERFCFCWFVVGLTIFSISPHQRADLLTPIWAPAALLGGREMARLFESRTPRFCAALGTIVLAGALLAAWIYYHPITASHNAAKQGAGLRALAERLAEQQQIDTLQHTTENSALQFYLHTMKDRLSPEDAAAHLADGGLIVVGARDADVMAAIETAGLEVTEVDAWVGEDGSAARILRASP
jgi:4-amino-4-deoxy-L-arabinose transferase-like glycosyltransferase